MINIHGSIYHSIDYLLIKTEEIFSLYPGSQNTFIRR